MAKYMNNSKNYETYFEYFSLANIENNLLKDRGKSSKSAFVIEISLFQIKKICLNLQMY